MVKAKSNLRGTTSALVGAAPAARVAGDGDAAVPEMEADDQQPAEASVLPDKREPLRQQLLADWLNRQELAAEFGVQERTISEWLRLPDGLPHAKIGKRLMFRIDMVREWLERRVRQRNATKHGKAQRQRAGR